VASAPVKLSCCIITLNEADRIEACIRAVSEIADEVVIVDSGSSDGTQVLAEGLGARVVHRDWDGYGPQKRFSETCASYDWILHLDADEVVTPALAKEISSLLATPPPLPAYRLKIVTVFPGHRGPRLWAEEYNNVRLYDRRRARFSDSLVHDRVETGDAPVGQLRHIVHHFSSRSVAHSRAKLRDYFALQAKAKRKSPLLILARLPFEYPAVFLKYYLGRRNLTGGLYGLHISHMAAAERVRRLRLFLAAGRDSR
jgi:glycosyltransferase involved in cell wall biosynthesis